MKLPQKTQETNPSNVCPDCGKAVDLKGPCWIRISPDPARTNAWHLDCRDRLLREGQEQFRAALDILAKATQHAAKIEAAVAELQELLGVTT